MSNELQTIINLNGNSGFLKFYDLEQGFVYYKNYRLNLKTKVKEKYQIQNYFKILEKINFKKKIEKPRVIHLFYEFGFIIKNQLSIDEETILVIDLKYLKTTPYSLKKNIKPIRLKNKKSITFEDYQKKFLRAKNQLLKGNSYQLNLTFPAKYSFFGDLNFENLIGKIWLDRNKRGAYAHASHIPDLNKIFISNSPECLFQIKQNNPKIKLWSMPIKGSVRISNTREFTKNWEKIKKCKKNQSELFMISDLIRNDLSRIENKIAKIIFKKRPLVVPKILHQYSVVAVEISRNVSLSKIITSLFPGGSVTGAPKRKSMEILFKIESKNPRGFYCGSTIILHKTLMAGSINIRSSTLETLSGNWVYGSGGGITLQSLAKKEFEEMNLKIESFLNNFIN